MSALGEYLVSSTVVSLPVVGDSRRFPVRRVYCVGRNYVEHIREMKEGDERDPPFFFQKPADAIVEAGRSISYPKHTADFHHEVELVVAIGADSARTDSAEPLELVFGYAIGLDLTRRDRQREAREARLPWEVGKSFDQSAPCGAIYKATDIGHPGAGKICLHVNGVLRQTGDLSQMIWDVREIIENLSRQYVLRPGDLIFTGTPSGVGALQPGDHLEAAIANLGTMTVDITRAA